MSDSQASTAGASTTEIPELLQLGARLRQARQSHGLELDALAERLRIGTDQLDALEAGDRNRLREPVFVIAQARRVAGALGIDISDQIAGLRRSRLMETTPRQVVFEPVKDGKGPIAATPRPATPPTTSGSHPARPVPLPPVAPAASLSSASLSSVSRHRRRWLFPLLLGSLGLAAALVQVLRHELRPEPVGVPGVAVRSAPAPGAPAAPAAPGRRPAEPLRAGGDTLVLQSREPSWVEVRDSEGTTLFQGTLVGERRFPLGKGLAVLAGRPDLVTASIGAGPPKVLGPISAVGWRRFLTTP